LDFVEKNGIAWGTIESRKDAWRFAREGEQVCRPAIEIAGMCKDNEERGRDMAEQSRAHQGRRRTPSAVDPHRVSRSKLTDKFLETGASFEQGRHLM
jgi:hypothetical protein